MPYTWMSAVLAIIGGAASSGVPIEEIRAGLRGMTDEDAFWTMLETAATLAAPAMVRAVEEARESPPAEPCDHIWLPSRGIVDGVPADQEFCTRCGARQ